MLVRQCSFKKENSNTFTKGWVDAKKIKNAKKVQLLNLDRKAFWEVLSVGETVKNTKDIHRTFHNNI